MPDLKLQDNINLNKSSIDGQFRDVIVHSDGREETREWSHNIIVDGMLKLFAAFISGLDTPDNTKGAISYWAVGSGEEVWDTTYPDVPLDQSRTQLVNETGRKRISAISFIDYDNQPVEEMTNRILVTAIFTAEDCLGDWREFAIFAGNATEELNSGIMLDHKIHQHYIKTDDVIVKRQIRFIFS